MNKAHSARHAPSRTPLALVASVGASLAASVPSAHAQSTIEWATPVDGDFGVAGNWSPMAVPGPLDTAVLSGVGPYTVLTASRSLASASVANADAVLAVVPSGLLDLGGSTGSGTIVVNADQALALTSIRLGDGARIATPVVLNTSPGTTDLRHATVYWNGAGSPPVLTEDGSISGRGQIYYTLTNEGLIEAAGAEGLLELREATVTQGATGVVRSIDSGLIALTGGTSVTGGLWDGTQTGRVFATGNSGIADATMTGTWGVGPASLLDLGGTIDGGGTIVVNADQAAELTSIRLGAGARVATPVVLNTSPGSTDLRHATMYWSGAGVPPVITEDASITGRGQIYYTLTNEGLIEATGAEGLLELREATVTQGATGVVRSIDSGLIALTGGTSVTGGLWDGTQTGRLFATGNSGIADATMTGTWGVGPASLLDLGGTIDGGGTIVVNDDQAAELTSIRLGDGARIATPVVLNTSPSAADLRHATVYWSGAGVPPVITEDGSITGRGQIYYTLTNDGLIEATGAEGLLELREATVTQGVAGVVRSVDSGLIALTGGTSVTGGLWDGTQTGRLFATGNSGIVDASMTGVWGVGPASLLDLGGTIDGGGTIVVNDDQAAELTSIRLGDGVRIATTVVLNTSPDATDLRHASVYWSGAGSPPVITEDGSITGRGQIYYALNVEGRLAPGTGEAGVSLLELQTVDLALTPTARIEIDAAGTDASEHDRLAGSGSITLDGSLDVDFVGGYVPEPRDQFEIISATTVDGFFADIDIEPVGAIGPAHIVYTGTGVVVVICAADRDADGELTIFDFLAFQNLFGAGDLRADLDEDGQLTIFDFLVFQNRFAAGCP